MIFSNNLYCFIGEEALDLVENQTLINDDFVHTNAQSEIENDYISNDNMNLLIENQKLKDHLSLVKNINPNESKCPKKDESSENKPKKKVTKFKSKTDGEWVIGGVLSLTSEQSYEQYNSLESPLSQFEYNMMYKKWTEVDSYEELQNLIKEQSKDMTRDEFLSYLSEMTGRLPYNDQKSQFNQSGDIQNSDSLWSMIQEQKQAYEGELSTTGDTDWGGICGDIHFAALMIGEIAKPEDFEYFTASYAMGDSQHVYMFAIDKESGQAVVVNYDSVQVVDNPDGIESMTVKNDDQKGSFNNIGTNIRIFANSNGNAEHVSTIKSALGAFIYQASVDPHNQIGTPLYNNFNTQGVEFSKTNTITKGKIVEEYDEDGNLITSEDSKTYTITNGVKLLHGTKHNGNIDNTDIFTLVYYRKKSSNTNGFGSVQDPNKLGSESTLSLSGTNASMGNMYTNEDVYVMQVNYNQALYKTILRTDRVDIQANGKMNVNLDYYNMESNDYYGNTYRAHSGDGNLETSVGIDTKFRLTERDFITSNVSFDHVIGLKEQRRIFDFKHMPNNVRMTPNVLRTGIGYQRNLGNNKSIGVNGNFLGTQVGGIYNVSTSFQNGKQFVLINYQNDANGINRSISSNLLPTAGQEVSVTYGARNANILGSKVDYGANVTFLPDTKNFFVGGSLKVNIGGNTKNKSKKKIKITP